MVLFLHHSSFCNTDVLKVVSDVLDRNNISQSALKDEGNWWEEWTVVLERMKDKGKVEAVLLACPEPLLA